MQLVLHIYLAFLAQLTADINMLKPSDSTLSRFLDSNVQSDQVLIGHHVPSNFVLGIYPQVSKAHLTVDLLHRHA